MPRSAQIPIKAGEIRIGPKATTEASMCKGTRAFSSPSISATRFSPSFFSALPSVVT